MCRHLNCLWYRFQWAHQPPLTTAMLLETQSACFKSNLNASGCCGGSLCEMSYWSSRCRVTPSLPSPSFSLSASFMGARAPEDGWKQGKRGGLTTLATFYQALTFWSGKERLMAVCAGIPPHQSTTEAALQSLVRGFFYFIYECWKGIMSNVWAPVSIPHYTSLSFSILKCNV